MESIIAEILDIAHDNLEIYANDNLLCALVEINSRQVFNRQWHLIHYYNDTNGSLTKLNPPLLEVVESKEKLKTKLMRTYKEISEVAISKSTYIVPKSISTLCFIGDNKDDLLHSYQLCNNITYENRYLVTFPMVCRLIRRGEICKKCSTYSVLEEVYHKFDDINDTLRHLLVLNKFAR